MAISNRQKKFLRFFEVSPAGMSRGAAGWEIGALMANEDSRDLWDRYLYVTHDFGSESDQLMPFEWDYLESVELPEGWSGETAIAKYRENIVEEVLQDGSPFDQPQPEVIFEGSSFVFTGKFVFGSRKKCQEAVVALGGIVSGKSGVPQNTDYLVIGVEGSKAWKRSSYGRKIEAAIVFRRESGKPAIISESHWSDALRKSGRFLSD